MTRFVVGGELGHHAGQRHQAVQGAAVEQMPTQSLRQPAADRTLPCPAGPIDRHDRYALDRRHQESRPSSRARPTLRAAAGKPGNEVATLATSVISIASRARTLAIAKDIATR